MENIWGVFLQTVTVSLTAVLLLVLKRLLADKLSPRWQYGVWIVLALRILIPVSMNRDIFGPWPFWVEHWKNAVESGLSSTYSAVYQLVRINGILPYYSGEPVSVTDWLFVIYGAGIVICLLRYLIAYLRLRSLLRQGEPASEEMEVRVRAVSEGYGLKRCPVVAVRGLPSAFISGIFRPVLAVPADTVPDEKILLHELLHLKYRDSLQSIFWCILRSLHWFNPLVHYAFDRIDNDMESLCDQRVLERLEGEERREYGAILLNMANDRYSRVPGTSSISNGGKNIARRIEAIVRFKQYPKGMALVSVCTILALLTPVLVGTAADYSDYTMPVEEKELDEAMTMARLNRCSTKAGALDTYAKGLMYENGIYIAMVSPSERHAELEAQMRRSREENGWPVYHLESGWELEYVNQYVLYEVYNLRRLDNGDYEAVLGFYVEHFQNEDGDGYLTGDNGEIIRDGAVLMTVRLWYDGGWLVEERGERRIIESDGALHAHVEPLQTLSAQGETGTVTVENVMEYSIEQKAQESNSLFGWMGQSVSPANVNAQFGAGLIWSMYTYDMNTKTVAEGPKGKDLVGVFVAFPSEPGEAVEFSDTVQDYLYGCDDIYGINETTISNSDGSCGVFKNIGYGWNGILSGGGGVQFYDVGDEPALLPGEYRAAVYWGGKLVETLALKEAKYE